jgi:hypothetical protein
MFPLSLILVRYLLNGRMGLTTCFIQEHGGEGPHVQYSVLLSAKVKLQTDSLDNSPTIYTKNLY